MSYAQNKTILLAEDDLSTREVTTMVLEAAGYRVIVASNGTIALHLLLQDGGVDLLLSDIQMPGGIDGIELAQRARMQRHIPAILISAHPRSSFEHFPDDVSFLAKPYDRRSLLAAVYAQLQPPVH